MGKIQNADIKTSAELAAAGATDASLPNDNKIYVASLSKRLDQALSDGDILGPTHSSDTTTHGTTGDIVGTSDTQVLTNKDIDGGTASNTNRITAPKDTKANLDALTRKQATLVYATDELKAYIDDGINLTAIGTGSGGINFISANDGSSLTGWTTYADAAGSSPVDGTGGSPSTVLAVSTDSSIVGTKNFTWTKSAANRQGEGFSYDFSIDAGYRSKPMTISALYRVDSGTYADNDMSVWVYDVTNAVLIQPSAYQIKNTTGVEQIKCEFQAASNSTSYRLIFHTASVSASAYTLRFDSFSVSPNTYSTGASVTDWVAYTPTFTGVGTPSNVSFRSRRVGGSLEVQGVFTTGTVSASTVAITLGYGGVNGNVTTSSALPSGGQIVGSGGLGLNTASSFTAIVVPSVTTFGIGFPSASSTAVSFAPGTSLGTGNVFEIFLSTPIQGWGTSQVLSSETSTNVVSALIGGTVPIGSNGNPLIFPSVRSDTTGSYNASTGRYTCPVSGLYDASFILFQTTVGRTFNVYKNGSAYEAISAQNAGITWSGGAITGIPCNAGDILDVRPDGATAAGGGTLGFKRQSGPAQIAASEKISAVYYLSANSAPGAGNPLNFDTKRTDSHGSVTTGSGWRFTAQSARTFIVSTSIGYISTAGYLVLYKNGVAYEDVAYMGTGAGQSFLSSKSIAVPLVAGDYIDFRPSAGTTVAGGSAGSGLAPITSVSITSQG